MNLNDLRSFWRPTGSWGVVLNVILLPSVITAMVWFGRGTDQVSQLIALYAILASLFTALYGIRQIGKNRAVEMPENVQIARIQDDDGPLTLPQPTQVRNEPLMEARNELSTPQHGVQHGP